LCSHFKLALWPNSETLFMAGGLSRAAASDLMVSSPSFGQSSAIAYRVSPLVVKRMSWAVNFSLRSEK
jgi:hypothetical protein